ncbi:MAG: hypothetical protein H0T54_07495 [Geodermatophilaceae bacterium]|nr:hypothetical protein [Geodermatophilaceae bacterium]
MNDIPAHILVERLLRCAQQLDALARELHDRGALSDEDIADLPDWSAWAERAAE